MVMKKLAYILFILCNLAYGQVTVNSPTTSFVQVKTLSGITMTDFVGDQSTGQGADDFIVNGFYTAVNTSTTDPTQFYRLIFDKYDANKGFTGNLRLGIDVNSDNAVDLYFGISTITNTTQLVFQLPAASSVNTTPNNSSMGSIFNNTTLTSANYSYYQVDPTSNDGALTFSVSMSVLNAALAGTGKSIITDTYVHYIAFTSTNTNGVSQDLYGTSGNTNSTSTYSTLGAFTEYKNMNGQVPVVPEPSTYGFLMVGSSAVAAMLLNAKRFPESRPVSN